MNDLEGRGGICGVDEAGRGPVLGPLVVAAVSATDQESLKVLGVKDSKELSRARREAIYHEIVSSFPYRIVVREAAQIDQDRRTMSLNELELRMFAEAVGPLAAIRVYADCADVNESSFGQRLQALLPSGMDVISRHKADRDYPVVSAASILAKVTRDRLMDDLSHSMGVDMGSGYPSDPKTISFLEKWINDKGNPPPCARASWETTRRLLAHKRLSRITDW
ncbi:MAG: ribonuclease HII [Candidatus Methanomethylophilaceae archaeon]|nr:ribonuclease HII [Candidatus Methanomethylophilaceae archaeon]